MKQEYSDCYYCGGSVEEQHLPREVRWKGDLIVFDNVPMGVCTQCGEKFLKPGVAKSIDDALHGKNEPSRTMEVPVFAFEM